MVPPQPSPRTRLARENLISFSTAVRSLPEVNGRRHSPSTLYRWARWGIRGIRLEYLRIGRCMVTSHEALERFFARLAAADDRAAAAGEGSNRA